MKRYPAISLSAKKLSYVLNVLTISLLLFSCVTLKTDIHIFTHGIDEEGKAFIVDALGTYVEVDFKCEEGIEDCVDWEKGYISIPITNLADILAEVGIEPKEINWIRRQER